MTTQMLVFGVLLLACFIAPWAVGGTKTIFSWSVFSIEGIPFAAKLTPIFLALTGVAAIAGGALGLSSTTRAFAATGIGLAPLVFQVLVHKPFVWQMIVGVIGSIALVSGLILRSRHPYSQVGRIVATVGALAIIALYLIPSGGVMPIKDLIDGLSAASGKAKLLPIIGMSGNGMAIGLIPFFMALAAFAVWAPAPSSAGAHILAWALLFWGLVAAVVALLLGGDVVAHLKAGLSTTFYLPLAGAAWMALACFGIAGVVSDQMDA